mgnify:CR=1 FL=1
MAKRGDLKPVDEWEESIRNDPNYYSVVGFIPGTGNRNYQTFEDIRYAKAYAAELIKDKALRIRSAMVYAVGKFDNFALVGTYNADGEWKQVIPKRY